MASADQSSSDSSETKNTEEITVSDALEVLKNNDDDLKALLDHRELRYEMARWRENPVESDFAYDDVMEQVEWHTSSITKDRWESNLDRLWDQMVEDETFDVGEGPTGGSPPEDPPQPEVEKTWSEADSTIRELFDERTAGLAEAMATVPVRMMFTDVSDCPVCIAKGNPSVSKSTVAGFFKSIEHVSNHDIVSPKAFVSPSTVAQDGEFDLLPRIKQRTMLVPEMNTWFSGDKVDEFMPVLSRVFDGNGLTKSTGAKGTTGYEADYPGEYRFGLIGATTPLPKKAWVAIGNAGSRFIFHPMPKEDDLQKLRETLQSDNYTENMEAVKDLVRQWWLTFWHEYDGEVERDDRPVIDDEYDWAIMLLSRLLARGRSVDYGGEDGDSIVDRSEQESRIYSMFRRMAQARAMLYGKDEVDKNDLELLARCAFASMPEWRIPLAKILLNPNDTGGWGSDDIADRLGVSRKTALKRMREMGRIGLADIHEDEAQGGKKTRMTLAEKAIRQLFQGELDDAPMCPWPFN
jgi:hypothetical protein